MEDATREERFSFSLQRSNTATAARREVDGLDSNRIPEKEIRSLFLTW